MGDIVSSPPILARPDSIRNYVHLTTSNPTPLVDKRSVIASPVLLFAPPRYADAEGSNFVPPPPSDMDPRLQKYNWREVLRMHEESCQGQSPETYKEALDHDMCNPQWCLDILGPITKEEARALEGAHDKVFLACGWITQAVCTSSLKGWLRVPPPILSRTLQEISNGMIAYAQAGKITLFPFPFPFTQMVTMLLMVMMIVCPLMVAQLTKSLVLSPLLTLFIMTAYWGLNEICAELENPYGEDANDIPIVLMHKDFCTVIDELRSSRYPSLYDSLYDAKVVPPRASKPHDDIVALKQPGEAIRGPA